MISSATESLAVILIGWAIELPAIAVSAIVGYTVLRIGRFGGRRGRWIARERKQVSQELCCPDRSAVQVIVVLLNEVCGQAV
jgi:hypothetical protein